MWTLTSFKAGMVWEGFEEKTLVKLSPREEGKWVREMGKAVWIGWCSEWARKETSVEPGHSETRPETGSRQALRPCPSFPFPCQPWTPRAASVTLPGSFLLTFEPRVHRPLPVCLTAHLTCACEFPSWAVAFFGVPWSQVCLAVLA